MLQVYLNYPNSRVSMHGDTSCGYVRRSRKCGQRCLKINLESFSGEVKALIQGEHRFASTPEFNDMWLEVDFGDEQFERAVVEYVCTELGKRYEPFCRAQIERHC